LLEPVGVEQHADQERERIAAEQPVGGGVLGDAESGMPQIVP